MTVECEPTLLHMTGKHHWEQMILRAFLPWSVVPFIYILSEECLCGWLRVESNINIRCSIWGTGDTPIRPIRSTGPQGWPERLWVLRTMVRVTPHPEGYMRKNAGHEGHARMQNSTWILKGRWTSSWESATLQLLHQGQMLICDPPAVVQLQLSSSLTICHAV